MKQQIILIHGGDTFETYEQYLNFLREFTIDDLKYFTSKGWKDTLQDDLGDDYEIIAPKMPNKINARYVEWKIWFEKLIPLINGRLILIGHSLGGIFLAKYLSENLFPKKIIATFMIAACFDDMDSEYSLVDFKLPIDLKKFAEQSENIYLYHSKDDEVVPYSDLEKYKMKLPDAKIVSFENRGHFNQLHIPELVEIIKSVN